MEIVRNDLADLKKARKFLEKDSLAIRLANLFGDAAEDVARLFPETWRTRIEQSCIVAIEKSWEFSITTMSAPYDYTGRDGGPIFSVGPVSLTLTEARGNPLSRRRKRQWQIHPLEDAHRPVSPAVRCNHH